MSVEVECERVAETDAALCIKTSDGEKHWIPFSQVKSMHFNVLHQKGTVEISDWIAQKEGLD